MSLIKFNTRFPLFDQMFPEILDTGRFFNEDLILKDNWIPAMNVKENKNDFEIGQRHDLEVIEVIQKMILK